MEIVKVSEPLADKYASDIPDLAYATGPISYDYHFGTRSLFDTAVLTSWKTAGTLFGWDATYFAMEGEDVLGFLVTFHAPEFRERIAALAPAWGTLIANGDVSEAELGGLLERSEYARWLNPETRPGIQYIHAIAVKPEHRGKQIGVKLINQAIDLARQNGHGALELDVLSDNPAVNFYQSMGLEILAETRAPKPMEFGVPPEYRMGIRLS